MVFGRRKLSDTETLTTAELAPSRGFFSRIKAGLSKTRQQLTEGIVSLVRGKRAIDDALLEELETQLLLADVGVETTTFLMGDLHKRLARHALADADAVLAALKEKMCECLRLCEKPLEINHTPFVMLLVGINGSGKTTTIGKLAKHLQQEGRSVLLSAGDTFRAAAVAQLQAWGERNNIPVIAQHAGADSASVSFDAMQAAKARNIDVLLADTAGRLHTQQHLMEELKKIKRVMGKVDTTSPHETLLVLDASIGQNALHQAEQFHNAIGVTGLCVTKLDGTAKGGILFAIAHKLHLPIRFIGVGEGIDDLRPFVAEEFVEALFTPSND